MSPAPLRNGKPATEEHIADMLLDWHLAVYILNIPDIRENNEDAYNDAQDKIWENSYDVMDYGTVSDKEWMENFADNCDKEWNAETKEWVEI